MIKVLCLLGCMLIAFVGFSQQNEKPFLLATVTAFHQALVSNDTMLLKELTDDNLSYGHSNGWVESRKEVMEDLKSGLLTYQRYDEDSVTVTMNESNTIANVRFVADIDATMKGNSYAFHLKVLEVWVRKTKNWMLFARQAVK